MVDHDFNGDELSGPVVDLKLVQLEEALSELHALNFQIENLEEHISEQ